GRRGADRRPGCSRTLPRAGGIDPPLAASVFEALEQEASDWFTAEGVAPADRQTKRVALMRYHGQGGELVVDWTGDFTAEKAFAEAHQALYGFTLEAPIELVTVRVEAVGHMAPPVRGTLAAGAGSLPYAAREVHFASGVHKVPVLDRDGFGAGARFAGPAIVTQLDATTLVTQGWSGEVHASGALLLTRD